MRQRRIGAAVLLAALGGAPSRIERQLPRVSFIAVDTNVKLEVLDWGGSGRPVVLLAGNGQTAHSFDRFAPLLARFYHVYGITRRGFGASSRPATGYSTDRRADDVLAVIDSLKLTKPVIAGHSLGGEELSSIGARHADRVAGLIYLDPSTGAYDDGTHGDFVVDVAEVKNHLDALRADGANGQVAQMDSVLTVLRRTDLPALETALARMQDTLRFLPRALDYPLMPPPTNGRRNRRWPPAIPEHSRPATRDFPGTENSRRCWRGFGDHTALAAANVRGPRPLRPWSAARIGRSDTQCHPLSL